MDWQRGRYIGLVFFGVCSLFAFAAGIHFLGGSNELLSEAKDSDYGKSNGRDYANKENSDSGTNAEGVDGDNTFSLTSEGSNSATTSRKGSANKKKFAASQGTVSTYGTSSKTRSASRNFRISGGSTTQSASSGTSVTNGSSTSSSGSTSGNTTTTVKKGSTTTTTGTSEVDYIPTQKPRSCFTKVFQDDFNSLSSSNWNIYDYPGHGGNGWRDPANVSITSSAGRQVLNIKAAQHADGTVHSGGIAHRYDQTYGYWEFLVRADPDPSGVTSAVILTWPKSENWPSDGENNIFETGTEPNVRQVNSFIHFDASNKQYWFIHDRNIDATKWVHMAMEWTPDQITLYHNGKVAQTVTNSNDTDPDTYSRTPVDAINRDLAAIPDNPHHMTVQLDAFAKKMPAGVRVNMQVDWVKVFKYEC